MHQYRPTVYLKKGYVKLCINTGQLLCLKKSYVKLCINTGQLVWPLNNQFLTEQRKLCISMKIDRIKNMK
jgi:hypothetical protein